MSWVKHSKFAAVAFTTMVALGTPGAALAGIVVASGGPSAAEYPVGKKLPDSGTISLEEGDVVTILASGKTRVLSGKGPHSLSAPSASSRNPIYSALTRQRNSQRVRTGAVRPGSSGQPIRSPNLWYVDVTKSGTMCIIDANEIRLWRPEIGTSATYTVEAEGGQPKTLAEFDADSMVAIWDVEAVPVVDGGSYRVGKADAPSEITVNFTLIGDELEDPESLAGILIEKGCSNQLELLTSTLATADGS